MMIPFRKFVTFGKVLLKKIGFKVGKYTKNIYFWCIQFKKLKHYK
jgi:hypothetical protein